MAGVITVTQVRNKAQEERGLLFLKIGKGLSSLSVIFFFFWLVINFETERNFADLGGKIY